MKSLRVPVLRAHVSLRELSSIKDIWSITDRIGGLKMTYCGVVAGDVVTNSIKMSKYVPNVVQKGRKNTHSFTSCIGLP